MFGLSWLTSKVAAIGGAILAILLAVATIFAKGKQAGIDSQKAKEQKAHEEDLEAIKRASTVRPIGSVQSDPNNRNEREDP